MTDRLHRARGQFRSGDVLAGGRAGRAGWKADRFRGEICVDRGDGGIAGKPGSFTVRAIHGRARGSARVFDAGCGGVGERGEWILRGRFYKETGDLARVLLCAALIAALTLALLEAAQGGSEFVKQILALGAVAALVVFGGRMAFDYALVFPPIVACLAAFGCAGMLGLLRRSLVASARLDSDIGQLALSGDLLAPAGPGIPGSYHWTEGGPVTLARGWLPEGSRVESAHVERTQRAPFGSGEVREFALRSVEDGC